MSRTTSDAAMKWALGVGSYMSHDQIKDLSGDVTFDPVLS